MVERLTLDELGVRSGAPVDALRAWVALGLIGGGADETSGPEDVERARLIQLLLRRGIGLEPIAQAAARLSIEGHHERVFCSQECLQRFVAPPERYRDTVGGAP